MLYFLGSLGGVLEASTGQPRTRFLQLRKTLDTDSDCVEHLRHRTSVVVNEDFKLTADHYFLYA